jgi:polyhydroxyalkanoate synthesis repressor PhaR
MKRTIRRYANRKMYDSQARRPITLTGIAGLLRKGVEVQVVDHPTGVDITNLTLSKVLLEQEKKKEAPPWGSFFLEELIRHRSNALLELVEKSLSTSLEAIGTAEGKLRETVRDLISLRKIDPGEGLKLLENGLNRLVESKAILQFQLEKVVHRVMPSADSFSENEASRAQKRLAGDGKKG